MLPGPGTSTRSNAVIEVAGLNSGGAHGVVLDLKVGVSAPPPCLASATSQSNWPASVAFLCRVCEEFALPVAFFGHPNQAAAQNEHQRAPSVKTKKVISGLDARGWVCVSPWFLVN